MCWTEIIPLFLNWTHCTLHLQNLTIFLMAEEQEYSAVTVHHSRSTLFFLTVQSLHTTTLSMMWTVPLGWSFAHQVMPSCSWLLHLKHWGMDVLFNLAIICYNYTRDQLFTEILRMRCICSESPYFSVQPILTLDTYLMFFLVFWHVHPHKALQTTIKVLLSFTQLIYTCVKNKSDH